MKITPDLLQAAVGCARELAERFAPYLDAACAHYQIDSRARLAAFLAHAGHESQSFAALAESMNYSVEGLLSTFGRHRISEADARRYGRAPGRPADQEAIANLVYGGEWGRKNLGNVEPGDGWRYRARGCGITGRSNYRESARRMQSLDAPDFEVFPDALAEPRWVAWAFAEWWASRGLNGLADVGAFDQITQKINGGQNGADDRRARWERAQAALAHVDAPDTSAEPVEKPATAEHVATEWDLNNPPPPAPEKPMAAPLIFLKAALPFLIESIPRLGRLFGSGSEVSERNLKAVEMAADTIKAAVGASTEQEAIERLRTDPAARAAADQAIADRWYELVEAGGGGIDGARKASLAYSMPDGPRFWLNPSFWISLILIAMPMLLLVDVLFVHPESYVGELRTQIVTGVLMVIGMVGGYWIGTSISSARKDERAAP